MTKKAPTMSALERAADRAPRDSVISFGPNTRDHIRRRRLNSHLLQKQLASQLGVNLETLKNWERGVGAPSIHQIAPIIEFLGYGRGSFS